jgi:hypothetical protein
MQNLSVELIEFLNNLMTSLAGNRMKNNEITGSRKN